MKKNAWTLTELTIAFVFIMIISMTMMSIFKPDIQKAKIFAYATLSNLVKGNIALIEKYNEDSKDLSYQDSSSDTDTYCIQYSDAFSLATGADCTLNAAKDVVNLTFPNEVTVQGLASEWKTPYTGSDFKIKNIVIDIDGPKGLNKVWVDRFPLRIYAGGQYTGSITPINCADDSIYDTNGNKVTLDDTTGKNPYCNQKFDASGSTVSKNFLTDNKVISYDVYFAPLGENVKAKSVMYAQSPMQADCAAYAGTGFYHGDQCEENGFSLHRSCASSDSCEACKNNSALCPKNSSGTQLDYDGCKDLAESNKVDGAEVACFTLLHKPGMGTSFLLDTMIGEIGTN